eukprot:UN15862
MIRQAKECSSATKDLLSGGLLDPEANTKYASRMSTFYSAVNSFSESKKLFENKGEESLAAVEVEAFAGENAIGARGVWRTLT